MSDGCKKCFEIHGCNHNYWEYIGHAPTKEDIKQFKAEQKKINAYLKECLENFRASKHIHYD